MPEIDYDDLPVTEDGAHVATLSPTGQPWLCPIGYLKHALETGFTVNQATAPFDPSKSTVEAVNTHLAQAAARDDVAEIQRVLAAEAAGRNRSTVTDPTAGDPGQNA